MDRLARWAKAPLLRFLLAGAAIFAADRALRARGEDASAGSDGATIVIDGAFVEALRARWTERHGRAPDAAELDALVRTQVREEALVREARAAGLDEGDVIVRRRLVQKIEFVIAGSVAIAEPDDEALAAWLEAHGDEVRRPARTTLEHVFFARDRRVERAEADARRALEVLRADPERGAPEALGDPFLRGHAIGPATDGQIAGVLGPAAAEAIAGVPVGAWQGPIASAFGWHVVRVRAREAPSTPTLDEVRERARSAWTEEQRTAAVERELARIVERYDVVRADGAREHGAPEHGAREHGAPEHGAPGALDARRAVVREDPTP